MKKFLKIVFAILLGLIVTAVIVVAITFPPVMGGMAAKTMCSCVYLTGRTPESVRQKELQVFPGLSDSKITLNDADSSVTSSILWKTSKAIYRKGVGCVLLSEQSEEEVRKQKIVLPAPPPLEQDSLPWPSGNRTTNVKLDGVNYDAISKAVDHAFEDKNAADPIYTHAVVILYNGEIVGEKYAEGLGHNSRLAGWSMTKSIANALIGILVKEGKLRVEDPAPVPEWKNDERKNITLNNLLQASSGLEWSESYFTPWSQFHTMFIHRDDKAAYAASLGQKHEPNTVFQYSSGTTNIVSRIIRQTVGNDEYYKFPYEKLFYKIGMNQALIEADASGTFVASSYGYASARDWARFGLLYLNDGVWNGERILPEGWVTYSTTPAPAAPLQQYGAQIWLNKGDPKDPTKVENPGLPNESFLFEGFERQAVVVVPSKKLVVVRIGVTHNQDFSLADLVNGVIEGLPD